VASQEFEALWKLVQKSLSPQRFLVYNHSFAPTGTTEMAVMHELELKLASKPQGFDGVAALRLLYSALDSSALSKNPATRYSSFLENLPAQLLNSLEVAHVVDFLRCQADLQPEEECLLVWTLDELNAAQHSFPADSSANWSLQLCAALAQARCAVQADTCMRWTLLVPMVASNMWSAHHLENTSSQHAKVKDLSLLPLSTILCSVA
jgi:hypothetical protein